MQNKSKATKTPKSKQKQNMKQSQNQIEARTHKTKETKCTTKTYKKIILNIYNYSQS